MKLDTIVKETVTEKIKKEKKFFDHLKCKYLARNDVSSSSTLAYSFRSSSLWRRSWLQFDHKFFLCIVIIISKSF